MSGFIATEQVEALTYDFNPHVAAAGTIPEPTADQIERYRSVIVGAFKEMGLSGVDLKALDLSQMDSLMEKSKVIEAAILAATADLTGISEEHLSALPFRVSRAFLGWIMGQFFSPEA